MLYRILNAPHPRTGTKWHIYPSYDFAHGQSDAIEGVTHSLCTLEFADHRPLYDWFLDNLPVPSRPRQIEFARLNLTHTVLSKRVLTGLVRDGHVSGWDDPRMPTLAGLRRRGVPPEAIRDFVKAIGVARADSVVDIAMLEHAVREVLNRTALRRMAVLQAAQGHHRELSGGTDRRARRGQQSGGPDGRNAEGALRPGNLHRARRLHGRPAEEILPPRARARGQAALRILRHLPRSGEERRRRVVALRCTYDPDTRGGNTPPDGRKVKATLHWVAAADAVEAEVHLVNQLFVNPSPDISNFAAELNPNSLEVLAGAMLEPAAVASNSDAPMQFERQGYFVRDPDGPAGKPIFIRTVGLRDTFSKTLKT